MKIYKDLFSKFKKPLFILIGLFLFVIIWEIIAFATGFLFLPEFFSCLGTMFSLFTQATTFSALGHTLLFLVISLIISLVLGVLLGTIAGYYKRVGEVLAPLITILRAFPTIALVLLLVIYVPNFSLYVCGMVLFPIIYQATYDGTKQVYENYQNQILLEGKNHLNVITKLILPLNINNILLGLVQAFGLGIKIQVMAETFGYSVNSLGIGNYIQLAYRNVEYEKMMAYVLICVILALLIDGLTYLLKRKLLKKNKNNN